MSASPVARQLTQSQAIPSRRILINSASDLPNDYSTTPGGTFFSTTPGGTRIVYERNVLMQLRNSPLAKTPPKNLQFIPGFSPGKSPTKISGLCENNNTERKNSSTDRRVSPIAQDHPTGTDAEQFEMDL